MTLNRSVIATITLLYLGLTAPYFEKSEQLLNTTLWSFGLYYAVSAGIFLHIVKHPGKSVGRRFFAMVHDFTMISWIAIAAGETAGLLYPLYLWTILGNGFRFGARYIYTAGGIALMSFGVVLWVTGFGQLHPELAVGLWIGLLVLPLYVSRLLRQLSEATRQAEQASRAKSAFLASVSHELRTPLNAIIGLSDLLRGQGLTREQVGSVALIGSAGRSLLGLINSLLEFSRLEAGRMPVNLVHFDLFEMAAQIRALLAPQARDKGLRLALQIAPGTPRLIEADRKHIEEIIFNLVGNAIKFTTSGHVLIRLGAAVPLSADASARLILTVTDTGAGIPPEAQSRIFERFSQADETIVDRFGGTGLGLAICKQLVELQGGTIGVTSVPGEGSTFTVELDVREGAGHAPAPVSDRVLVLTDDRRFVAQLAAIAPVIDEYGNLASLLDAVRSQGQAHAIAFIDCRRTASVGLEDEVIRHIVSQQADSLALIRIGDGEDAEGSLGVHYVTEVCRKASAGELAAALAIAEAYLGLGRSASERFTLKPAARPLAVLVAEDNPTNQIVTRAILEGAGHSVVVVGDGDKALDALADAEFDVVLMDVNMPGLNGLEATKLYRFGVARDLEVPIIGLTADATPEMQEKCMAAGMAACAAKPIEAARLIELIEEVTASARRPKTSGRKTAQTEPPDAPLFNAARVQELARIGGVSFPRNLIREFVPQAGEVIDAMRGAVQRRDLQDLRSRAHFLKSSAGAVGADRIASRCAVLQSIGPAQFEPLKESTIDDIAEDLRAFRQDADVWFDHTPAR